MTTLLKTFGFSALTTLVVLLASLLGGGAGAAATVLVLIVIEIAFSFDNAIINAKALGRLSPAWQRAFLTIGILIAIFGMRIIFPIGLVAVSAGLSWSRVVDLAAHHPEAYAAHLEAAHPLIAAFGGAFLLMLVLYFFFDRQREVVWIRHVELPLQRLAKWWLPPVIVAVVLAGLAWGPAHAHAGQTLRGGVAGVVVYALLQGVLALVERAVGESRAGGQQRGWAALAGFLYLELLDASFSFDGVVGAFAITSKVVLIAAGLGVGAVWVRSLTIFLVRHRALEAYKYLEHGAHYAVAVLAACMLLSIGYSVPDALTGTLTVAIIGAAVVTSMYEQRRVHA